MASATSRLHAVGAVTTRFALIAGIASASVASAGPVVQTRSGKLEGVVDGDVTIFEGVPLGAPPVGALRWTDARAAPAWTGVRPADRYAPVCMQPKSPLIPDQAMSEDCLYLNVWTSKPAAAAKLPVMVMIYGGGFTAGSASPPQSDGAPLAKRGVVVVTLPYRVGTLGYMALPELTKESTHHASGGYAMSDLVLGLRWVKQNIASFGGDPANVTILGCSAGGHMSSYLLASPPAKGLFQRAIPESGSQFTRGPESPNMGSLAENERVGSNIERALGAASLADLRALPAERIIAAQDMGGPNSADTMALPSVDGYYLPADPYTAFKTGRFNKVDVLTGWASNEGLVFGQMYRGTTAARWREMAAKVAPGDPDFLKTYPANTDQQALKSAIEFTGDEMFGYQNYKLAQFQVRNGKTTYVYYFERPTNSPMMKQMAQGMPASELAGLHCGNDPYVTGNMASGPLFGTATASDVKLSDTLMSYWTNFARTGDPNGPGLPTWPAYDATPDAKVLRINETVEVGSLPSVERMIVLDTMYEDRRSAP